ncbi:tRNA 4-thiouridine(8) synthase ThiI [soil metagenome]
MTDPKTSDELIFLIRLAAELSTKSRGTRRRFTRRLAANIGDAFRASGATATVADQWTRLLVRTTDASAAHALARIPGISSYSRVEGRCEADLAKIVETGTRFYADRVRGRRYAIRVRRSGEHPFSSGDVQVSLGTALNPGATVDLNNPDITVEVEVRDDRAYFFSDRTAGLGGLPLGVEGRAVCLLSGGFDSAVAAWLMLKRGVQLDYVFCNLAGGAYERSVVSVSKVLADRWSFGTRPQLHVIDFSEPLDELRAKTHPRYWQIILKRLMYRSAVQVAEDIGADAIVTGEAIGQVSSQTLMNLASIEAASDRPIFRPLLAFDKMEIVDISRRIGTYEISSKVREYCAIAPGNPITNARPAETALEEAQMNLDILRTSTDQRRVIDVQAVNAADLIDEYLFIDTVPPGAVILDVRSNGEWAEWHHERAVHHDFWELSSNLGKLERDRIYVVYCSANVQSARLADQMQRMGLEAYALKGGTRALKALQKEEPKP